MIVAHLEEVAKKHDKDFIEVVEMAREICDDLLRVTEYESEKLYKSNRRINNE